MRALSVLCLVLIVCASCHDQSSGGEIFDAGADLQASDDATLGVVDGLALADSSKAQDATTQDATTQDAGTIADQRVRPDGRPARSDARPTRDAAVPTADASPIFDAGPSGAQLLPLGKVLGTAKITSCPSSAVKTDDCQEITFACDGLSKAVQLKISEPIGALKGTVILGTGGGGVSFYEDNYTQAISALILPLLQKGYRVVQRKWNGGWFPGTGNGIAPRACYYATLIDHLRRNSFSQGAFCISGNSGGSAEAAFALAHYGRDAIVDAAVLSGGPPMARIDLGCLGASDQAWYSQCKGALACPAGNNQECEYDDIKDQRFDQSFGFSGACHYKDVSKSAVWRASSVLAPGAKLHYPQTEVRFVLGDADCSIAAPQAQLYYQAISSAKQLTVARAGHGVADSVDGAQTLLNELLASCQPHP